MLSIPKSFWYWDVLVILTEEKKKERNNLFPFLPSILSPIAFVSLSESLFHPGDSADKHVVPTMDSESSHRSTLLQLNPFPPLFQTRGAFLKLMASRTLSKKGKKKRKTLPCYSHNYDIKKHNLAILFWTFCDDYVHPIFRLHTPFHYFNNWDGLRKNTHWYSSYSIQQWFGTFATVRGQILTEFCTFDTYSMNATSNY